MTSEELEALDQYACHMVHDHKTPASKIGLATWGCAVALLRDALKAAWEELAVVQDFRAESFKEIRHLLGEDESDDEAIAGSVCAIILTHRELGRRKREVEAQLSTTTAALAAVTLERDAARADMEARIHTAMVAGRAIGTTGAELDHIDREGWKRDLDSAQNTIIEEYESDLADRDRVIAGLCDAIKHVLTEAALQDQTTPRLGLNTRNILQEALSTSEPFTQAHDERVRREALSAVIAIIRAQPYYPDTHTGMRQQWVKDQIEEKVRHLATKEPDATSG